VSQNYNETLSSFIRNEFEKKLTIQLEKEIEAGQPVEIYMEYVSPIRSWFYIQPNSNKVEMFSNFPNDGEDLGIYDLFRSFSRPNIFPHFYGSHLKSTYNLTLLREKEYDSSASGQLVDSE